MLKNVISSRSSEPAPANIDLLKEIRPLKKRLGLEKANQSYLERWVGLNREDDQGLFGIYAAKNPSQRKRNRAEKAAPAPQS